MIFTDPSSHSMKDLLVLKTGGSSFSGFHRDEFTTLPGELRSLSTCVAAPDGTSISAETDDRLFSTSVTLSYTIPLPPNIPLSIDNLGAIDEAIGGFIKVRYVEAIIALLISY